MSLTTAIVHIDVEADQIPEAAEAIVNIDGVTEVYSITGAFLTDTTFEATFTADFVGGANCADCRPQTWSVVGTRRP